MYPDAEQNGNPVEDDFDPSSYECVSRAVDHVRSTLKLDREPSVAIICGSGLGGLAENLTQTKSIAYSDIPGFPKPSVKGHVGKLLLGNLGGKYVVCMQGRIHPYEGHSLAKCAFPVRVMRYLGAQTLILTNAAGGLNDTFKCGDMMVIKDQLFMPGLSGRSPLFGHNDERIGPRFPSLNNLYDEKLRTVTHECAANQGLSLKEGIYCMVGGPQFETPAENRFLSSIGADAVGMSVAHESIVARHCGMIVLGISLITNLSEKDSNGAEQSELHAEVLEAGKKAAVTASALVKEIVTRL